MKKIKIILLVAFLGVVEISFSGNSNNYVDSILKKIEKASDTDKVKGHHQLFLHYEFRDVKEAKVALERAMDIAVSNNYDFGIATTYNYQGYYYEDAGKYYKAIESYQKALEISKQINSTTGISAAYNNIGLVHRYLGNLSQSLDFLLKSLSVEEKLHNKKGIAGSYINIGMIYRELKDHEKAMEYYEKGLAAFTDLNAEEDIAQVMNNMGNLFNDMKQYEKGLSHHLRSFSINRKINNQKELGISSINVGNSYYHLHKADSALYYHNQAAEINQDVGNLLAMVNTWLYLGKDYYKMNQGDKEEFYYKKSLKLANELGAVEEIKYSHQALYEYYQNKKDYKLAHEHYKNYASYKDSLFNEQSSKDITRKEMLYEFDKHQHIEKLKRAEEDHIKKLIHDQEITEQRSYSYALIGLTLVIIAGAIWRARIKHMEDIRLRNKNQQLAEKNEVIKMQKNEVEHQRDLLEEKNKEITDSIQYAKRIQTAILPPQKLIKQYLQESFILYKPKDIVAGDFYWFEIFEEKIYYAAADCTGHGVPGAMVSVMCSNALTKAVKELEISDPGKILDKVNEILENRFSNSEEKVSDGMDVALCKLDFKTNILEYAGANNPLCLVRDGELLAIKADKQPIGKFENRQPFTTHSIDLQSGDSIYIFSDGYVDQFGGPKGKKFKYAQLKELLLANTDKSMAEQREVLDKVFEEWKGALEQVDDVCVIGVRVGSTFI